MTISRIPSPRNAADLLPLRHALGHFGRGQRRGDEVDPGAEAGRRADAAGAGIILEVVRTLERSGAVDLALRLHDVGVEAIAL
jgi:hypothetical protein